MSSSTSSVIQIQPEVQLTIAPEQGMVERYVLAIKDLFRITNVEKLVYVDDKFDVIQREDEFIGLVKSKKADGVEFDFITDIDTIPDIVFEARMKELWANSTDDDRMKFLDGLETKDENTVPIGILDKYFSDVLITLNPTKWEEQKGEILESIVGDNKILCLFDSDLGVGKRSGQDLAKSILEGNHKDKIYCGIFSHIFQPEAENTIRATYDIDKKLFYPISKHRLQSDQDLVGFSQGIKNVLLVRHVEELKTDSIKIIKLAQKEVERELEKIDPMTFNSAIQKTSYLEGVWEIETLFRLTRIFSDQETKRAIIDHAVRTKFNDSISQVRKIDKIETVSNDEFENNQLKNIIEKEYFYSGDLINQLHYPLKNGDVFQINAKKYILLSQVCNISIRSNGERDNNINYAYIVEIIKLNSEDVKFMKDIYKLRRVDNENFECVKYSRSIIADLDYFDLVVYNTEGISTIDLNIQESNLPIAIHGAWKARYRKIRNSVTKYKNLIIAFNNKLDAVNDRDKNTLLAALKSPKCMKDLKIDGVSCYDKQNDTFTFPIKRIMHYKEPYSTDILKKFMDYQSRTGFDREFED